MFKKLKIHEYFILFKRLHVLNLLFIIKMFCNLSINFLSLQR
jgi:hypothetical protein